MNRKLGAVPLSGGAATTSNTTSPRPRFTSVPSGVSIHPAVWPLYTYEPKTEAVPLWGGSCVLIEHKIAWAEA